MALPKGVKSPVDYTKLYMSNELDGESINEKKDPQLPKKGNVKSINQVTFKPGDTFASIGARARHTSVCNVPMLDNTLSGNRSFSAHVPKCPPGGLRDCYLGVGGWGEK